MVINSFVIKHNPFFYLSSKVSAYISHWNKRTYPLGLIPGCQVLLNNVIKIISKKGNGYFVSTVFTNIQVLDPNGITADKKPLQGESGSKIDDDYLSKTLIQYCIQQNGMDKEGNAIFKCLLTLEIINKISICAMCKSCGSIVSKGRSCSFAGCHIPITERAIEFKCNASFQMEDETYGANICVKDLNICRNILYFIDDHEWKLILKTVEHKGEILFLSKKTPKENILDEKLDIYAGVEACFIMLCEVYPMANYSQFLCKLRPFSNDKQSHSANWNNDQLNFMCLDAKPNLH